MTAPLTLHVTVPSLHLVSEANRKREHWAVGYNRAKKQKLAVKAAFGAAPPELAEVIAALAHPDTRAVITMTRTTATGYLTQDDDNLVSAFKYVRDEVARVLGVNDGDKRLRWVYKQEGGVRLAEARVDIEIVVEG
jgi:hypothetical protein